MEGIFNPGMEMGQFARTAILFSEDGGRGLGNYRKRVSFARKPGSDAEWPIAATSACRYVFSVRIVGVLFCLRFGRNEFDLARR
jgi:hypothetical protein